jgi:hypothetical protein
VNLKLRYFGPDGKVIDTVILYRFDKYPASCSNIPSNDTAWVEVSIAEDE